VMKAYFDKKTRLVAELKAREGANANFASLANLGLPTPPPAAQPPAARAAVPEPAEVTTELDESTPPPPDPEPPRRPGVRSAGQENPPR